MTTLSAVKKNSIGKYDTMWKLDMNKYTTITHSFFSHYISQPVSVNNWSITLEQTFTAGIPLMIIWIRKKLQFFSMVGPTPSPHINA